MIRSRHRIFSLSLATLFVLACCFTSRAEKMAVGVLLAEGDVLPGFCFFPSEQVPNPWPGVVVAANAGGIKLAQFHTYCRKLADKGFAVLLIDASGYPEWLTPGTDTWRKMPYHIWAWANHLSVVARLAMGHDWYVKNIDGAVDFLRKHPRVNPKHIAVSGFSQSANAALTYASGYNKIACVVWNNGGWPWLLPYEPSKLPPTLIFHGEADGVYSVRYARKLSEELREAQRDFECHIYPGERHMFNVYYNLEKPGDSDRPALQSSSDSLVAFLGRVLNKRAGGVATTIGEAVTVPVRAPGHSGLSGLTR